MTHVTSPGLLTQNPSETKTIRADPAIVSCPSCLPLRNTEHAKNVLKLNAHQYDHVGRINFICKMLMARMNANCSRDAAVAVPKRMSRKASW